ncbi:hypothetical protein UFOVP1382_95 [uncultured Caudovirales phage]|uniref:Uncharacterized protein n=1 Tax=uncultured Caudovirales phage TaxID=2100421 RepID=A0A6J5S4F7_9CAUD|nr:hypothetical protein UFOVP1382_95 [uncultured Caudovirales phage]
MGDIDMKSEECAWIAANYPDGTKMSFDGCGTCDSWTVGQTRCECGNRRVELVVDLRSDGFSAHAEAY